MGNFRRKKIIDTLRDSSISYKDKTDILQPYEEYIERVLDSLEEAGQNHNFIGLADKRVIEENSEFGTESQASLKSRSMAHKSHKYSVKDPDGIKHTKIDIEELKKRILDRNFSHVLNKANKEISDKGSLINFGPNLKGQTTVDTLDFAQKLQGINSRTFSREDSIERPAVRPPNHVIEEEEMKIDESDCSSSVSSYLNKRKELNRQRSLMGGETNHNDMISPRIIDYNRKREIDRMEQDLKCLEIGSVSNKQ